MKRNLKMITALFLSAFLILSAAGCRPITSNSSETSKTSETGNSSNSGTNSQGNLSGNLLITGSTSFQDLMGALGEAFSEKNNKVTVDVQAGGSGAGIQDAISGNNDIGMSSRELKTDGTEAGLNEYILAVEAIAVVVNPKNPIMNLTKDQIVSIFKGEITNWKDVGGSNQAITVFNREASSGTRGAFGELLKLEKTGTGGYNYFRKDAVTQDSTGKIAAGVSADPNAIGYIGLGSVDEKVKAVSIDGFSSTLENIKTGKYILKRPFLLLTKQSDESALAKAFIDFAQSPDGEALVEEMKLIKPSDLK